MNDEVSHFINVPRDSDFTGETVGERYQLKGRLASGGCASVYEAIDTRTFARVAVKVLHPEHASVPIQKSRFYQEARLAAQIRHPRLVPAYDVGWIGGYCYIVYEMIHGSNIQSYIHDRPLAWEKTVGLMRDFLSALAALHDKGVVHRDVSPTNCLVENRGTLARGRITDLGLARVLEDRGLAVNPPPATEARVVYGAEGYLDPERLYGKPGDYRSDVFSLAAVWYLMLVGTPLPSPNVGEIDMSHYARGVRMPAPFVEVLRTALLPIERRHHNAATMLAELDRATARVHNRRLMRYAACMMLPPLAVGLWVLGRTLEPAPVLGPAAACPEPVALAAAEPEPVARSAALPPEPHPHLRDAGWIESESSAQATPPPEAGESNPSEQPVKAATEKRAKALRPPSALHRALARCKPQTSAQLEVAFGPGQAVTVNGAPAFGELGGCLEDALSKHPPMRAQRIKL